MRCLEVRKNGDRLCLAGLEEDGVITAMVIHSTGEDAKLITGASSELHVGGSSDKSKSSLSWAREDLRSGDHVSITLMESDEHDAPEEMTIKLDDPRRGLSGSLVSLREEDDGSVSIVLDDMKRSSKDPKMWEQKCFVTHHSISRGFLMEQRFSDEQLRDFGSLVLARLAVGLGQDREDT